MEKSDLMNEYGSFFSTSKENIKSVFFYFYITLQINKLIVFFKIFKANTEDSTTKITNSIQPLIENQGNQKNLFFNNLETTYSSYNNCVGKSSIIFTKIDTELIIPLTNYKDSLIQQYNENLTKFKAILSNISHSKNLLVFKVYSTIIFQ